MKFGKINPGKLGFFGIFIGIANLVPGISGGTVAIAFGIYDELIASFKGLISLDPEWQKYPKFLLPLLGGLFFSLFFFARTIERLLEAHPIQMMMFFVGLILGAVPYIYRRLEINEQTRMEIKYALPLIIAFMVPIMLLILRPAERAIISAPGLAEVPIIFAAGFISTATMIIPGISGTMVLMVIGMYPTYIAALSNLYGLVLLILGVGKLLGVIIAARLIHYLLRRFNRGTYFAILGLLLGSVVNVWPGLSGGIMTLLDFLILFAGFMIAYFFQAKQEQKS